MTHYCNRCKKEKEDINFYFDKRRGKYSQPCLECQNKTKKEYHKAHRKEEKEYRDKHKEKIKQYFLENKEKFLDYKSVYNRMYRILKEYGVTMEQYEEKLKEQNGVCAICKQEETQTYNSQVRVGNLCIDHDHETGEIRGLLCMKCNRALGFLYDSPEIVLSAYNYISKFKR